MDKLSMGNGQWKMDNGKMWDWLHFGRKVKLLFTFSCSFGDFSVNLPSILFILQINVIIN